MGLLIFVCLLPILINAGIVLLNQVKWRTNGIENYSISLALYGPGGQPPQIVVVRQGKIVKSSILVNRNGEIVEYPSMPFLDLTVDDLLNQAYGCFLYTFCSVMYDSTYGYPKRIGGGFLEPSWIEVMDFQIYDSKKDG
jgi:hypothetical protein